MHNSPSHTQKLQQLFGFENFREGQETVIETLLSGESALAIFPTGSGKSLCYQYAATQLPHLTLVVSPLLALIKDQLDFLKSKNIAAASIDSTLTFDEYNRVVTDLRNNQIKILMISVERFKNERFRTLIERLPISLLVIDEAHCISEWGHNFRPDYLKLPQYKQDLNIPQTLLLTATATKKVKLDMASKFNISPNHITQTGFYRPNLDLTVQPAPEHDKNQALLHYLHQKQNQCGIIYVTLQKTAEQVASFIQNNGFNAKAYHAGLKDDVRETIQQEFMNGATPIIVATIAFGMGIDKSDIRFVIHYDLPKSIENYSQEIGRAGRDNQHSECVVLANLNGLNTLENFIYGDTPEKSGIQRVISNIRENTHNQQWECQLYSLSQLSNIRQLTLKTLLVQLEMKGIISASYSYTAQYQIKLRVIAEDIIAKFTGERQAFLSALFAHTHFKKTWGTVDIESLHAHYSCERKRIISALDYLKEQQLIDLKTSGVTEVYKVNATSIPDSQLTEILHQHFKQHEDSEIARIQLIIRFLESNACLSYGLAKYFDDQNAPSRCHHCSVCRGNSIKLPPPAFQTPAREIHYSEHVQAFITHLHDHDMHEISADLITRFLTGISVPVFTKLKVRSLKGFGIAEHVRYGEVYETVAAMGI